MVDIIGSARKQHEGSTQGAPMLRSINGDPEPPLHVESLDVEIRHDVVFNKSCEVTETENEKQIVFNEPGNQHAPTQIMNASESVSITTSSSGKNDAVEIGLPLTRAEKDVKASLIVQYGENQDSIGIIDTVAEMESNYVATNDVADFVFSAIDNTEGSNSIGTTGTSHTSQLVSGECGLPNEGQQASNLLQESTYVTNLDNWSLSFQNNDSPWAFGVQKSSSNDEKRCPSVIDLTSEADSKDCAEDEYPPRMTPCNNYVAISTDSEISLSFERSNFPSAGFADGQQCVGKSTQSATTIDKKLSIKSDETLESSRIDNSIVADTVKPRKNSFANCKSSLLELEIFSICFRNSRIQSMEKFVGCSVTKECFLDESDFVTALNHYSKSEVNDSNVKNLVRKKRKRQVSEIEFDPMAWQVVDGQLSAKPFESDVDRKGCYRGQLIIPVPESFTVDGNGLEIWQELAAPQAEKSRRSRTKTRQSNTKKTTIRIGDKYQAVIKDHPSTYDSFADSSGYGKGEVLWDPVQANIAMQNGEPIYEFLEKKHLELNVKYMLMESMHQSNYRVQNVMRTFSGMYNRNKKRLVEFTEAEHKQFVTDIAPRLLGTKKDFKAAADAMNRTKETMLVHYYLWKRQQKDYARIKNDRSKEPDYCCVCDDGGELIICELCRQAFHLTCCSPPLTNVPDGDWYCTRCVHASPARLRRLSNRESLDTSARGKNETSASKAGALFHPITNNESRTASLFTEDDASPGAASTCRRKKLRFAHKELIPTNLTSKTDNAAVASPFIPSGMFWDNKMQKWSSCDTLGALNPSWNVQKKPEPFRSQEKTKEPNRQSESLGHDLFVEIDDDSSEKSSRRSRQSSESSYSLDQSDQSYTDSLADDNVKAFKNRRKTKAGDNPTGANGVVVSEKGASTAIHPMSNASHRPKEVVYDAQIPITSEGLLLNISAHPAGGVFFSGYRRSKTGAAGPSEQLRVFRAIGDLFLYVDGQSCEGKSFAQVRSMLKDHWNGQRCKYVRMRNIMQGGPQNVDSTRNFIPPHSHQSGITNSGSSSQVVNGNSAVNPPTVTDPSHLGPAVSVINPAPVPTPWNPQFPSSIQVGPGSWHLPQNFESASNLISPHARQSGIVNAGSGSQVVNGNSSVNPPTITDPSQLGSAVSVINPAPVPTPWNPQFPSSIQVGPGSWHLSHAQGAQSNLVTRQQANTLTPIFDAHSSGSQRNEVPTLADALKPLQIPDLIDFLKRRGILTAGNFLNANSSNLATEWARERQVPWDVALDFIGAARLQVRQWAREEGALGPTL